MVNVQIIASPGGGSMQQQRRGSGIILGLVALGLLALTAGPAPAVESPGPYYAKPAWDQSLPVLTRFLVLTNWKSEAVLDKDTGLVWERSPAITLQPWGTARTVCTARTTGNRKGWRLPSVHELQSLKAATTFFPALPPGHPFLTVQSAGYWSSSTDAEIPISAWHVSFGNGFVFSVGKTVGHRAWCVRGGMNADTY
jgi:hypothetical protein